MEFKEAQLDDFIQHEHPLILEDLQSMFQDYKEDDDEVDDSDLIHAQNFESKCVICGLGIDWYHRYYYKCSESSCSYSLHKSCRELSTTFRFPAHPIHTLLLKKMSYSWSCSSCSTRHEGGGICYRCSTCDYKIDPRCATFSEQIMTIHHPGHPHPLICVTLEPTLSKCHSCGKEHNKGVFYHCITCFSFSIHIDCVTLPFKLGTNHHVHMLTLSCFSDLPDYIKCRICEGNFHNKFWIYQCSKCRFYIHLHCKTSRGDIFSRGIGTSDTNFEAADDPNLLCYPLPDESHHILPRHVVREHCDQITLIDNDKGLYRYSNHEHPLLLINAADPSMLHNPMKRIKLVCNGCVKPITTTPFYVCNHGCDFLLHEWCTRLPCALENHPCHPQHKLVLFFSTTGTRLVEFRCNICGLSCNGLGYSCSMCNYRVDVHCGFIPERITHEAHPNHVLSRLDHDAYRLCKACNVSTRGFFFGCSICDFYLDIRCALHLPKRIKNKYDKHPLELSYFPIENHKSEYFCEVCEEELIPEIWFYHCQACGQSIHSAYTPVRTRC